MLKESRLTGVILDSVVCVKHNAHLIPKHYPQLSVEQREKYARRLLELLACRGPTYKSLSRQTPQVVGMKANKLIQSLAWREAARIN